MFFISATCPWGVTTLIPPALCAKFCKGSVRVPEPAVRAGGVPVDFVKTEVEEKRREMNPVLATAHTLVFRQVVALQNRIACL
jgi:hypothetical protein